MIDSERLGVLVMDRQTNGQTDNGDCRVAFPMEYFV